MTGVCDQNHKKTLTYVASPTNLSDNDLEDEIVRKLNDDTTLGAPSGLVHRVAGATQRHLHWALMMGGALALGAALTVSALRPATDTLEEGPAAAHPVSAVDTLLGEWRQLTVKKGDTLSTLFSRARLGAETLYQVLDAGNAAMQLQRLFPGQTVKMRIDADGQLTELVYNIDLLRAVHIFRDVEKGDFTAKIIEKPVEKRITQTAGIITSSLFFGAQAAGLTDKLTMELADIFAWDIDFNRDLQDGDRFSVVYEEELVEGKPLETGRILAAEFVNQGQTYRAIRYTDSQGRSDFYTPDGQSLRTAFLRSPIPFGRVSSGFDPHRLHPVLNTIRAHKGVDYAAAIGTPIRATGEGRIAFRGTQGGYGNTIVIEHSRGYSTLYAHMSNFARLRLGARVRQGDIIGYVGRTGLATGPHLHYEFRINGRHRDPLTVRLPKADPVPYGARKEFRELATAMLERLERASRASTVALKDS